jgi:anthranilate/para-aminobenzoate synthase component II
MHGKTSPIHHDGKELFADLPNPFNATRIIHWWWSVPACQTALK